MSGFEYTLVYYIVKDINAPLLYITLTRGCHLVNAFDDAGTWIGFRGAVRIDE